MSDGTGAVYTGDITMKTGAGDPLEQPATKQDIVDAIAASKGVAQAVNSVTLGYTQTLVTTGAAKGLPATRTWTSGPDQGKTTTYTWDAVTGGLLSKVTA